MMAKYVSEASTVCTDQTIDVESRAEQIPSDRTCSTEVDASLVRGVPINPVMRGFCQAFSSKSGSAKHYSQARHTNKIDDFFSHDWDSARWRKALTLYHYYNGFAASMASILTGVLLAILQLDAVGILPKPTPREVRVAGQTKQAGYGIWCIYVCPLVFVITLLNYHKLEVLRKNPRLLFVDKFCIDQAHEGRKRAGILQLAGFLRNSQKLVICWTPKYFTRLWCVFELASWKYLGRELDSVMLMPSSQVALIFVAEAFFCSFYVVHRSVEWYYGTESAWILLAIAVPCGIMSSIPAISRLVKSLSVLPKQLQSFTFQASECFCCSNNHVHPDTGEPMQCDRKLIYTTLVEWFSNCTQDADDEKVQECTLKQFDDFIQNEFASWVLQNRGPHNIPYCQVLMMTLPVCWAALDCVASYGTIPVQSWLRLVFCDYAVFWCLLLPSTIKACLYILTLLDLCSESCKWCCIHTVLVLLRYLLPVMELASAWWVLILCNWFQSILPVALASCALLLLTTILYGRPAKYSSQLPTGEV